MSSSQSGPPPPSGEERGGRVRRREEENDLVFTQRKLEELYEKTYRRLSGWRSWAHVIQEVLVWKRRIPAVLLYLAIHWVFYYFATDQQNFLSQLSSFLFWLLIGDIVWRAATRDGQGINPTADDSSTTGGWRSRLRRRRRRGGDGQSETYTIVSFERALLMEIPEEEYSRQLFPYEVICLTIARWWMWIDNLWLALRHWSIHEPLVFCMVLSIPGVVLIIVGMYIPTLVLLYTIVMALLVWPYVWYHNVLHKVVELFRARFPVVLQKGKQLWTFVKTLLTRDDREIPELSLSMNSDESEAQSRLHDEAQMIVPDLEREEEGGGGGGVDRRDGGRGEGESGEDEWGGGMRRGRRMNPGMSVLQDSLLGLPPDAFHGMEDSLASFGPAMGEFPSISNFDQSLTLPRFPSITASYAAAPASFSSEQPSAPPLSAIKESQEALFDELDPYHSSMEFGLDQIDPSSLPQPPPSTALRKRTYATTHTQPTPHPLTQYVAQPPRNDREENRDDFPSRSPPPPYDAAMAEDGAVNVNTTSNGGSYNNMYPELSEDPMDHQTVPKSSSTPFMDREV